MESPNERTVPIEFARQLERELNESKRDAYLAGMNEALAVVEKCEDGQFALAICRAIDSKTEQLHS